MNLSKAVLTAEMSQKVYDNYSGVEAWMRDNGYDNWAWFDADGTQAFTCRKRDHSEIFISYLEELNLIKRRIFLARQKKLGENQHEKRFSSFWICTSFR